MLLFLSILWLCYGSLVSLFSTHTKGDDDVCNDEGTAIVPGFHGLLRVPCAVGTLQVASPHYEAV